MQYKRLIFFFRSVVKIISSLLGNKFNIPQKHANTTTSEPYTRIYEIAFVLTLLLRRIMMVSHNIRISSNYYKYNLILLNAVNKL